MDFAFTLGTPKNISSSLNVMPRSGGLIQIFVASASSTPTITVYDSATTTTTTLIVNTFTPTAGTAYPICAMFKNGCYIAIGGTVDLTAMVVPA